ncbi:AlkZ family DNA glycosylase [Thermobifida halotolerans]|uniref:AlkZ family DNA glycosylase n=1 Tax=Thermobifida halotolerans TaxID=483545 RepID=A0A399FX68_9ACTN|nr:winged helix DNA-binding domain-containing protein [Thermobifida halotolerans]UOE18824.1 AlkZ family DNA glycosylase [Thermobifida halotolerans]
MGTTAVLTRRALNRAVLDRQSLLRRSTATVPRVLERLVGLQAQTTHTWYVGLWSRLADYTPDDTVRLLTDGRVVRTALMRSTLHLVTADDCLWLRPLVQPMIERGFRSVYGRNLAGVDPADLAAAGRALVEERPRTFSELGRELARRWPDHDPAALAQAIRAFVPLVQLPPRGVWGRSGRAVHTSAEAWTGRSPGTAAAPERLVLRYLAAFGPATVRDVQTWCGLTRLGEVVDRLRPRLAVFRGEDGAELFDLPDAPRPDPDTPAPVRFLYDFDNLLRSHADRRRVLTVDLGAFTPRNGIAPHTVLVDGVVTALWAATTGENRTAALTVRPLRALSAAEEEEVAAEGGRLLAFLHPKAEERRVVVEPPTSG